MTDDELEQIDTWLRHADRDISAAVAAELDVDADLLKVKRFATQASAVDGPQASDTEASLDAAVARREISQRFPFETARTTTNAAATAKKFRSRGTGGLSTETQRELIAAGTPRGWSQGEVLIRESEVSDHVVLLTSGQVKVSLAAPSGRQVLMAIRGPGDLLGEVSAIDGGERLATVTALTDVKAVSLTGPEFHRLMLDASSVTVELLKMVAGRLRESTQRRLEFGAYDPASRAARLLIDYARAYGEPIRGGVRVKLRQAELAEAAGASREAVAKALKTFREAGAVRTNRCSFDVLNLDRLTEFAEGTPP